MYILPLATSFTLTYSYFGLTHNAKFEGKVHGVVVHASTLTSGSSTRGKVQTTAGSSTTL